MVKSVWARFGIFVGGGCLFFGTLWYWTQVIAGQLAYQRALGEPFRAFGMRLYAPWAWTDWAQRYYDRAPGIFDPAISYCLVICTSLLVIVALLIKPPKKPPTSHGSARFATLKELEDADLLGETGVALCQTHEAVLKKVRGAGYRQTRAGRLITDDGDQHVLVAAPTGTGKGESAARPTCYMTRRSLVAVDIKGELFDKTAGFRQQFSNCLRFAPLERDTIRINPLLFVRKGELEVADVQNIADILIDPSGGAHRRDHWDKSAADLLVGTMLHVLYAEESKTLTRVKEILSDPDRPVVDTLEIMLSTKHLGDRPHPVVAGCARAMLNKADKEQASVISSALASLTIFADPLVGAATSDCDFQIEDLMFGEHPVSLYLVIPAGHLMRLAPLVRLLLQQMARRLVESLRKPRHKLLFLVDEFPSLGKLDFFESALAFFRGYGIKCMLIIQTLDQLAQKYGERNSIVDNCNIRLFFAANGPITARYVSDLLGQSTIRKPRKAGFGQRGRDDNQEHGRPLLTAGEVIQFPNDEALLFVGGMAPYRAKKIFAYADPRFATLDRMPAPASPSEQAKELPKKRPHGWEDARATRPEFGRRMGRRPSDGQSVVVGPAAASDRTMGGESSPGAVDAHEWAAEAVDGAALLAEFNFQAPDDESAEQQGARGEADAQ